MMKHDFLQLPYVYRNPEERDSGPFCLLGFMRRGAFSFATLSIGHCSGG